METHWHYKVLGATNMIQGQYIEPVTIVVIADTEEQAIEKAKTAIIKNLYIVIEAQECVETHGMAADISLLQLEIQKQLLNLSKGKN